MNMGVEKLVRRSLMVEKKVWDSVQAVAFERGTTISQMIRDYLRGVARREGR